MKLGDYMRITTTLPWSIYVECFPYEWPAEPERHQLYSAYELWSLVREYEKKPGGWSLELTFLRGPDRVGPLIQVCLSGDRRCLLPKDHNRHWEFDLTGRSFLVSLFLALREHYWGAVKPRELLAGLGVAVSYKEE